MTGFIPVRKTLLRLGVLAAVAAAYVYALPPRARVLPALPAAAPAPGATVRGAIHVHTRRSDGTGTPASVAAAAARAGLQFVVLTDHGDGTRKADAPAYVQGVLVIDAVEISTTGGHVVGLGLPEAPYPLAGEPRDVVEDIARLGGFAIAAHPASAKPDLRWTDWNAPVGGLEWLNADSEWRDESRWSLARALVAYPARASESVAMLLDRPDEALRQWDLLTQTRQVVGVPAPDAHARIGLEEGFNPRTTALRIPSYETMFRTFSLALQGITLTGDAAADGSAVIGAIRAGRLYSTIDALARPAAMTITATSGTNRAGMGELLALAGPVTVRVDTIAPPEALIAILRDGVVFRTGDGSPIEEVMPAEPAVYRAEVRLPGAPGQPPVPWMVSNPIYVGRTAAPVSTPSIPRSIPSSIPTAIATVYADAENPPATIERSREAQGALDVIPGVPGRQLLFRYAVGGRMSESPYVALRFPAGLPAGLPAGPEAGPGAQFDRVTFTARANRPMRLAVQLRIPGGEAGERWQRSVYLDDTAREVTVYFDQMTAVGSAPKGPPPLDRIDSLLFVVDVVNTALGGNGQVWLDAIRYQR